MNGVYSLLLKILDLGASSGNAPVSEETELYLDGSSEMEDRTKIPLCGDMSREYNIACSVNRG